MYKLLIVDDERIIRDGISAMVDWEKFDISVQQAKNGLEGYEMISLEEPDIVMTDIKMPGLNGLQLIEKAKEQFPNIIFIILSGYGEFDFASKAMQYGVKYYLLKPADENEIADVLEKVISELIEIKEQEELLNSIKRNLEKVPEEIRGFFLREGEKKLLKDLTKISSGYNTRKVSPLVKCMLKYIDENIKNEQLSLSWMAKEVLYMNEDYLSRIFKKELNENFCQYVKTIRMEKAKKLMRHEKDIKIYEIAEQVGCGNNPQYFACIFKKYTGYTPTEYKQMFE